MAALMRPLLLTCRGRGHPLLSRRICRHDHKQRSALTTLSNGGGIAGAGTRSDQAGVAAGGYIAYGEYVLWAVEGWLDRFNPAGAQHTAHSMRACSQLAGKAQHTAQSTQSTIPAAHSA
jgi:hypothetical protein